MGFRKKLFIILIGNLIIVAIYAQTDSCTLKMKSEGTLKTDSFLFNQITDLQNKYFVVLKNTIAYFPELYECKIVLKKAKINTTLNVRPAIGSVLFKSRNHRKYIIRINSSMKDSIIMLDDVPQDALYGLLGHEFSHIADYKTRSNLNIICLAFSYLNKNKKEKYEKRIDSLTIQRGLGCSLYKWASFALLQSNASYKYKQFKRDIYMKPEEIYKYLQTIQNK